MTDSAAARPFRQMARNNRLSNLRLFNACLALREGEFTAPGISFFPSLKATLNHLHIVDLFYIDALEGGSLGPQAFAIEQPFDDAHSLFAAQQLLDERLIAVCEALTPDLLNTEFNLIRRGGRLQIETRADVLLHLFMHQTHHRGQAHALLSGTSVAPPQLDEFIVRDDAKFRVAELAQLGWSEADLAR